MSSNGWSIVVVKSQNWRTQFAPDYLDESSVFKAECDVKWHATRGQTYTPVLRESLDYLRKETFGQVQVGGFLHDLVSENPSGNELAYTAPQALSNSERKKRIKRQWELHSVGDSSVVTEDIRHKFRPLKTTQHRLVFSLDAKFVNDCRKKGLNPDLVLQNMMKRSIQNFTDKFHPGDSLGYAYGIHHDTDNVHVHVFVHPRTKLGARVGFSQQLKVKKTDNGQKNTLGFLRNAALTQARQWEARMADPQKYEVWKQRSSSARFFYDPRHSPTLRNEIKKAACIASAKEKKPSAAPKGRAFTRETERNPVQDSIARLERRYDELTAQINAERENFLRATTPPRQHLIRGMPVVKISRGFVSKEARTALKLAETLGKLFARGVGISRRARLKKLQRERISIIESLRKTRGLRRFITPGITTQKQKPYEPQQNIRTFGAKYSIHPELQQQSIRRTP